MIANENATGDNAVTVGALTSVIKRTIETSSDLQNVWVRGEISNLTRHSSGHMYFSLKDSEAQIRAVMFRRYATSVSAKVREGVEVTAHGSVSVYEKRGEYQIVVDFMRPAGMGALYEEFEKLKKKLSDEGLFDQSRKKEIPRFPQRIAVVTSPTGAAVRDVINVITRRYPAIELTVVPATVQGADAPASVRAALAKAKKLKGVDTILMVRGGGSIEDLWGFNDEALARDIAACDVPIISGVGHETDFTIADFVSDLRAPTPSAAAEISVPSILELRGWVDDAGDDLLRTMKEMTSLYKSKIETATAVFSRRRILDIMDRKRQLIDDFCYSSSKSIRYRIESRRGALEHMEKRLTSIDPRRVMDRGFAVCTVAGTDSVVSSVNQAKHGMLLDIRMRDGSVPARVDKKVDGRQGSLELE